jgi:cytochrome c
LQCFRFAESVVQTSAAGDTGLIYTTPLCPDDPGTDFGREANQGGREMVRTAIAIAALMVSAGGAMAQGDVALGKQMFDERCAGCHAVGEDTKSGPSLNNLIGRAAASLEGYGYSDGMVEAGQAGVVWDIETLSKFITKPRTVVNGSNMAFTGLRNPDDVANVIAYLATFSPPAAQ